MSILTWGVGILARWSPHHVEWGGNEKHDIVTTVMKDYHPHPPLPPPPPPHHHHHHHHEFRFYIISHHKIFTSQAECWTLAVLASSIRIPTSHECFGDVAPRPPLSLSPGFANSPNRQWPKGCQNLGILSLVGGFTHLNNLSQNGNLLQIAVNIKNMCQTTYRFCLD